VEAWRDVIGYEGLYQISNLGRVKSQTRRDMPNRVIAGKILRQYDERPSVVLYKGGVATNKRVHRLILEAFIGPAPYGMEGCHYDGDRGNNQLKNLRWDTRKNNHADKIRHGTTLRGTNHPSSKLDNNSVTKIVRLIKGGATQVEAAEKFNIGRELVSKIMTGRRWSWLTGIQLNG